MNIWYLSAAVLLGAFLFNWFFVKPLEEQLNALRETVEQLKKECVQHLDCHSGHQDEPEGH
jgi:hypothetical protein